MADARALLRAKRQEARIDHPLASYTSAGQLRCIACGTAVKHATAWEGHIGSKAHRTNAARLREERAREEQRLAEERESLKRKAEEVEEEGDEEQEEGDGVQAKKARVESGGPEEPERERDAPRAAAARSALPADFFSDPSLAPPVEDDEEEGEADAQGAGTDPDAGKGADGGGGGAPDVLDLEWQQFQQSVVNAPDIREAYERATVAAEPVLAQEVPQGFPGAGVEDAVAAEPEKEDEEMRRRRKEQEERELIMDRLLEEEQAQEEADARVTQLKSKLEALKKRREAAKAAKRGAAKAS